MAIMIKLSLPNIPAKEIFSALRKTPAGKYLKTALRFSSFISERETPALWRRALGPNAITFSHMENLYRVMKDFLIHESGLEDKQKEILFYATVCHDYGEAVIDGKGIGDIPDPLKTGEEDIIEREIFYKILSTLDVGDYLRRRLSESYEEVIFSKSTQLHNFFRNVEIFDYVLTAINVYHSSLKRIFIKNGKILVGNVLARGVSYLLKEKDNDYSSFSYMLDKKAHHITASFKYCLKDFIKFPVDDPMKNTQIDKAWEKWREYLFA